MFQDAPTMPHPDSRTDYRFYSAKLYRGFAIVGGVTIGSRILGFVRDVLIAAALGTSYVADAFFVAFRVPNILLQASLDNAFIPLFIRRLHGDRREEARVFAGSAVSGLTILLVALTLVAEMAMPLIMRLLAP